MMKNKNYKQGLAPLLILIIVIIGAIIGYIAYIMFFQVDSLEMDSRLRENGALMIEETSSPPSADEPVSDNTDLDIIEAELEATITGSASEELELMETEASEL